MKTKRLEILEKSLIKKEAELARRLDEHFDDVKSANGQPLNFRSFQLDEMRLELENIKSIEE